MPYTQTMVLRALGVADPVDSVAELIATQCRRLAEHRVIATTGAQLLSLAGELRPELIVMSLELEGPAVDVFMPKLLRQLPDVLVIGTFRELSVHALASLNKLGVDDFVAHPVNATEVFRAVSRRFHIPFRQHPRHDLSFEIMRTDGAVLGRTHNMSAGGVAFELRHPLRVDESVLVDLALPDGNSKWLRTRLRILATSGTPPAKITARAQFEQLRGEEHHRMIKFLNKLEGNQEPKTPLA